MTEYTSLEKIRLQKIEELRAEGIEPYPHAGRSARTPARRRSRPSRPPRSPARSCAVTLAGRIRAVRPMGKISFAHIEDGAGKVQLFFRANEVGQEKLDFFNRMFDIGDFVQASGKHVPHQDRRGHAAGPGVQHAGQGRQPAASGQG